MRSGKIQGAIGQRRRGRRMGRDVRYEEMLRPSLTTIHQSCADIGSTAMQVMLERIKNPAFPPRDIFAQPTLIVRQSCRASGVRNPSSDF